MVVRVEVTRELLEWARVRAHLDRDDLVDRFPKLPAWESGVAHPTLKQLESFARATHTPLGYLLLDSPPAESLPIPDFRTMSGVSSERPSADLLDTIYQVQQRQAWYREHAERIETESLAFVASMGLSNEPRTAAGQIRGTLGFDLEARGPSWTAALTRLTEQAEALGILVMVNGIVGSNTHRKLDPREFRGFALVDEVAPVIFINGADTKAAQIFTLAHELAHVWLGETALSDAAIAVTPSIPAERWCNQVAAELLVPIDDLRAQFNAATDLTSELQRLAARFRVSTLVVLGRVRDADFMSPEAFSVAYDAELTRALELLGRRGGGGNFYSTLPVRVSKRFARAVIADTLEGETLYRDAFQMLGFRKLSAFRELSEKLGVAG